MAILISILALLATFYQLYLQRVHNERSLRPLGQIDLGDYPRRLCVYLHNKGVGPLIIDRLTFIKDGQSYTAIDDCLDLDSGSYMRIPVNDQVKRIVLPNTCLVVFETRFEAHESGVEVDNVRKQLSRLTLKVDGRDIYDNKINLKREFEWFTRHQIDAMVER